MGRGGDIEPAAHARKATSTTRPAANGAAPVQARHPPQRTEPPLSRHGTEPPWRADPAPVFAMHALGATIVHPIRAAAVVSGARRCNIRPPSAATPRIGARSPRQTHATPPPPRTRCRAWAGAATLSQRLTPARQPARLAPQRTEPSLSRHGTPRSERSRPCPGTAPSPLGAPILHPFSRCMRLAQRSCTQFALQPSFRAPGGATSGHQAQQHRELVQDHPAKRTQSHIAAAQHEPHPHPTLHKVPPRRRRSHTPVGRSSVPCMGRGGDIEPAAHARKANQHDSRRRRTEPPLSRHGTEPPRPPTR